MKRIFDWIVKAVQDIYSFIYSEAGTVLALLKDRRGKFSWKRVTGIIALYSAIRFFAQGAWLSGIAFMAYAIAIGIMVGLEKE